MGPTWVHFKQYKNSHLQSVQRNLLSGPQQTQFQTTEHSGKTPREDTCVDGTLIGRGPGSALCPVVGSVVVTLLRMQGEK